MQTVLIVEDEKLIRMGIHKMIERFDIEVNEILEAKNGVEALEILNNRKIDLMLTDIKMPQMDGIELVSEVQKMENKPYIVTISGFDDFEYAVQMLRGGVKEYLLKPVERDKLKVVIEEINNEIEENRIKDDIESNVVEQQIKYLLLNKKITDTEKEQIYAKLRNIFDAGYKIMCGVHESLEAVDNCMKLSKLDVNDIIIFPISKEEEIKQNNFHKYVGISAPFYKVEDLLQSYYDAFGCRREAFMRNMNYVHADVESKPVDALEHEYIFDDELMNKSSTYLGVKKIDELLRMIKYLASDSKAGKISSEEFEYLSKSLLNNILKNYQNIIDIETEDIKHFNVIYDRLNLDDYIKEINTWIINVYSVINVQYDDYKNKKKIMDAKKFIDENYNKDINMAVVSNDVSMNYSLFSLTFKEYVGEGFNKYLRNVRIENAKKLLGETDEKVKDISKMVGFSSEKLFMKNFKLVTSMSPSEYRKQLMFKE